MSDHTKVYDPYIYADGIQEPRTVERYSCRECDCEWPCTNVPPPKTLRDPDMIAADQEWRAKHGE
jgi:hypothetical protein